MAVRDQTLPYKEHQRLLRFLLAGLLLNAAIVLAAEQVIAALWHNPGWAYLPAKVFATAIVVFWNYFANRLWTFQEVQS